MPDIWQSKIVGHDRVAPDQLLAHPMNFRGHPARQREALRGAIAEVGFVRSVTVNKQTGNIVDGHARVVEAIETGQPTIDVEYVDLTPAEEAMALATFDAIGQLATVDAGSLDALLKDVRATSDVLQSMINDVATDAGLDPPDFQPASEDAQSRLDRKASVVCPECKHEFTP